MSGNVILIIAGILFVAIGTLGAGITVAQIQVSPELVEKRSIRIAAFLVGVTLSQSEYGLCLHRLPRLPRRHHHHFRMQQSGSLEPLPQLFRDTCRRAPDLDDYPGATAGVECTPPDGATLV